MHTRNSDHYIEYVPNHPEFYENTYDDEEQDEQQDEDYLIDKYLSDIESEERYYDKLYGNK